MTDLNDPRLQLLIADCERYRTRRESLSYYAKLRERLSYPVALTLTAPDSPLGYRNVEFTREELQLVAAHVMIAYQTS